MTSHKSLNYDKLKEKRNLCSATNTLGHSNFPNRPAVDQLNLIEYTNFRGIGFGSWAEKIDVLGLILSFPPYRRSADGGFPL